MAATEQRLRESERAREREAEWARPPEREATHRQPARHCWGERRRRHEREVYGYALAHYSEHRGERGSEGGGGHGWTAPTRRADPDDA